MARVDSELPGWAEVADKADWQALLLGNGASINIWPKFEYSSLFRVAVALAVHELSSADCDLFSRLGTEDFERVLRALKTAQMVDSVLGRDIDELIERYDSIREALIYSIREVHVPWASLGTGQLEQFGRALLQYPRVFSLNYDLVGYWALLACKEAGLGSCPDFFWSGTFDLSDIDLYENYHEPACTELMYLHGALHLYRDDNGGTAKLAAAGTGNTLLDLIGAVGARVPLFVSEGDSDDKVVAIHGSDYLAFVYDRFVSLEGPLVVFGSSLGKHDEHLLRAMRTWKKRRIAVSIMPAAPADILRQMANLQSALPDAELLFFDAPSHPLGSAGLRASVP